MRLLKIAIPCAVLLTGYAALAIQGSGDAATPALQPGQWEIVTETTSVEAPDAPDELLQQLRASMPQQPQRESQCITPEQARNPAGNLMGENPPGCGFSDTNWSGGIVRIRGACRPPDGAPAGTLALDGTYAAQQIDYRLTLTFEMPNPDGTGAPIQTRFVSRITGRRTGDCAAPDPRANENSLAPAN